MTLAQMTPRVICRQSIQITGIKVRKRAAIWCVSMLGQRNIQWLTHAVVVVTGAFNLSRIGARCTDHELESADVGGRFRQLAELRRE